MCDSDKLLKQLNELAMEKVEMREEGSEKDNVGEEETMILDNGDDENTVRMREYANRGDDDDDNEEEEEEEEENGKERKGNLWLEISEGIDSEMTDDPSESANMEMCINDNDNDNDSDEENENENENENEDEKSNKSKEIVISMEGIGLNEKGELMPGFEEVQDSKLSFNSESDFAIFNRQIVSEVPLQKVILDTFL
ncbi:rhoptry neck protein 6 [Reticulomyxa filosa]|uniref:Rhoptry neck protein 6 n=1 Tax=Reticulomyxa filosa TaxID=46433 RepID=X6P1J7_RETFI|nr:rhoptry neck protein 6 [Reticulomyxa filosa]|eukprot:ETO31934.1 rhoptry neck protein 6 [Reticulomyxa filosa]